MDLFFAADLIRGAEDGVGNPGPGHFLPQGGHRHGNISKDKHRESKQVKDLFPFGTVNLLLFRYQRHRSEEEQGQINADQASAERCGSGLGHDQVVCQKPGESEDQVGSKRSQGNQSGGGNDHQHVVALKTVPFENASQQSLAVMGENLIKAFGPAQPLIPGSLKGFRLLIVEHRVFAVADLIASDNVIRGKFNIFCQQMVFPAPVLTDDFGGNQKTGAGDGAAGTDLHAGAVEKTGFPDKPQAVSGGDPVGAVIFGIPVAGDDLIALGIGAVHGAEIAGIQHVVRVKDQKSVEGVNALLLVNALQGVVQSIPLPHLNLVEPADDFGAVLFGAFRRPVGAVVGDDVDRDQFLGIILFPDAFQQSADDCLLVSGRDQHRVSVFFSIGRRRLFLFKEADKHIDYLVQIAAAEQQQKDKIKHFNKSNHSALLIFFFHIACRAGRSSCVPAGKGKPCISS